MGYDSFLKRMPSGIQGVRSRGENNTVDQRPYGATAFPSYGVPVKIVAGLAVPIGASDLATAVQGLLIKPYPTSGGLSSSQALAVAVPPTSGMADILRRGFATVVCNAGTPADQGQPYIRTANPSGAKVVGGIEAASEQTVTNPAIVGTGTGTIACTVTAAAIPGTWVLTLQTTSNTSKVTVIDPNGVRHPDATVGTAYSSGGLSFTITAGGIMTAGDSFSPVVAFNTIAPARWFFTNAGDAAGNVEIEIRI